MTFFAATVIAVGVAMDAFAVSVADGTRYSRHKGADCLRTALAFGGAQMLMTLMGFAVGDLMWIKTAGIVGHGVAALILFVLGTKMIGDGCGPPPPPGRLYATANRPATLAFEAVAVSIDAFAAGVGIAALTDHILGTAVYIGAVAALFSAVGFSVGHYVGGRLLFAPELLGGAMLVMMALHIAAHLIFWP